MAPRNCPEEQPAILEVCFVFVSSLMLISSNRMRCVQLCALAAFCCLSLPCRLALTPCHSKHVLNNQAHRPNPAPSAASVYRLCSGLAVLTAVLRHCMGHAVLKSGNGKYMGFLTKYKRGHVAKMITPRCSFTRLPSCGAEACCCGCRSAAAPVHPPAVKQPPAAEVSAVGKFK